MFLVFLRLIESSFYHKGSIFLNSVITMKSIHEDDIKKAINLVVNSNLPDSADL